MKQRKIYSKHGIIGLSTLFGPPAFAYMAWHNAKSASKDLAQRMKRAAFVPLAALVMLTLIDFVVFSGSIPKFIYASITIGLPVSLYESVFKQDNESHKEKSGEFLNPRRTLAVMLLFSVVLLATVFGAAYGISKARGDDLTIKEFIGLSLLGSFDGGLYDSKLEQIIINEDEAVEILNSNTNDVKVSFLENLDDAEGLYKSNIALTQEMLTITDIPGSFTSDVELLDEYYTLKVQQIILVRRAELENNPAYIQQVEVIQDDADRILKELES